jgi:hypothetical protein
MGHTPNRMEDHWQQLKPLLQQEWSQLSDADLQYINKEFDRLVEVIRQRYGGRTEIMQEAAIRDRLNEIFKKLEE